jgi:hypothetical protein
MGARGWQRSTVQETEHRWSCGTPRASLQAIATAKLKEEGSHRGRRAKEGSAHRKSVGSSSRNAGKGFQGLRNGPRVGRVPPGPFGRWPAEHLEELYGLCRDGLLDVLLMDVGGMGFSAWRRVMPRLLDIGVQGSPHAWGEPLRTYYAAQIACGLSNVPIVEGVPGNVDGVDDSGYVLEGGVLTLPEAPGFGLDLCS